MADLPFGDALVESFELNQQDYVFVPYSAEVRGTEYKRNLFVVTSYGMKTEENLPIFGEIKNLVVIHSTALVLVLNIYSTAFFNESLKAYAVEENPNAVERLMLTSDLPDHRPISSWASFRDDWTYLCPKSVFY